jgi:hypothetical protein
MIVPRLNRTGDRNRQHSCGGKEQPGCARHRRLSVQISRTVKNPGIAYYIRNSEPHRLDAGESKTRQNSLSSAPKAPKAPVGASFPL